MYIIFLGSRNIIGSEAFKNIYIFLHYDIRILDVVKLHTYFQH